MHNLTQPKPWNFKNMRFKLSATTMNCLSLLALAVLITGCKTVDSSAASKFATSVTTVKTQADTALSAAAALTRDENITYVTTLPKLNEGEFAETPPADVIMEWNNALSAIEAYASKLATLTSPDAIKSFDTAATGLASQLTQTATRIGANTTQAFSAPTAAGLATAFTETANLILAAKAQATARKVAMATDPQIKSILTLLADEIGIDHAGPGQLRTTVYRAWNTERDNLNSPFLSAADPNAKKAVVQQYATILAGRDAEDAALADLRSSLLALADAHHALAEGDAASVQSTLALLTSELKRTQDLYSQFSADLKPAK
jgi:hypothetical protein